MPRSYKKKDRSICMACGFEPATEFIGPTGNKIKYGRGYCKTCLHRAIRTVFIPRIRTPIDELDTANVIAYF